MNRDLEPHDLIELATASRATKGGAGGMEDTQGGHFAWPGLSDD